jgi:hypothetical protein
MKRAALSHPRGCFATILALVEDLLSEAVSDESAKERERFIPPPTFPKR